MKAGDRVQIFGSVPLPEGGFPYRGEAVIQEVGEDNQLTFNAMPSGVEAGDYICAQPAPACGLAYSCNACHDCPDLESK